MRIYKKQYVDISGKTYNRLIAICYVKTLDGRAIWKFKCQCGTEKEIDAKSVRTGNTKSCGCAKLVRGPNQSLTGQRFGYLTVIECDGKGSRSDYRWKCKCDCGNHTIVDTAPLKYGHIKSCGCLMRETVIRLNKQRAGPNHPLWNPNITQKQRELRRVERKWSSPRLNRWRTKVYSRDRYTCQKCKDARGGNLNAHHICSWAYYPRLRYILSNGITLCRECHKGFHNKFGRIKNTRKQLEEFLI